MLRQLGVHSVTLYVYVTLIVSFIYRVLQNLMKSESVGSAAKVEVPIVDLEVY